MLKLLQEIRGFAEIASRRPPRRSPGVVLTQMRPHIIQAALPRRKLNVQMDEPDRPDIPHPVKINHVKQSPDPRATIPVS